MTREDIVDLKNTLSVIILEYLMTVSDPTVAGLIREIEKNSYKVRPWLSLDDREVGEWWLNVRSNVELTDFYMGVLAKLKHRWFMSEEDFSDYLTHVARSYTSKPSRGIRLDKMLERIPSQKDALETLNNFPQYIILILISDLSPSEILVPLMEEQKKKDDAKKRNAANQSGLQPHPITR